MKTIALFLATFIACNVYGKNIDSLKTIYFQENDPYAKIIALTNWLDKSPLDSASLEYIQSGLEWAKKENDRQLLKHLNVLLAKGYYNNFRDFEQSEHYCHEVLKIRSTTSAMKNYECRALSILAMMSRKRNDLQSAEDYLTEAIKINQETRDSALLCQLYNNLGIVKMSSNNLDEALEHYFIALDVAEKHDVKRIELTANINIGIIYKRQNLYAEALNYYRKAEALCQEMGNEKQLGITSVNMAAILYLLDREQESHTYTLKAKDIFDKIGFSDGAFHVNNQLVKHYSNQENYDQALLMASENVEIARKTGLVRDLIIPLMDVSDLHYLKGNNSRAQKSLIEAEQIATGEGDWELLDEIYAIRSKRYSQEGNFEAMSTVLQRQLEVRDSLLSERKITLSKELDVKYEAEKKQLQIQQQEVTLAMKNDQISRQRLMNWIVGLVAILLGLLCYLAFRNAQIRKKSNVRLEKQNEIIGEQNEKLQSLDQAKSAFFANISHELRTPLTLILNPLEQAIDLSNNKVLKQHLTLAHANSSKLLDLVNEIMDLSKLDSGKLSLSPHAFQLNEFIYRAFHSFESLAEVRGIQWELNANIQEDTWVKADGNKLEKILNNLLANAIKFSSIDGKVQLIVTTSQEHFEFKVIDSGKGIEPENVEHIFDRFYQAEQDGSTIQGGTGIGLALVKEFTNLMHGTIRVESEIGKGSSFILTLPLEVIDPIELPKQSSVLNGLPAEPPLTYQSKTIAPGKARILIVEDNLEMNKYLKSILQHDFHVTGVYDGLQALDILKNEKFDLILSDVMMPNMDGFALRSKVNETEAYQQIPFVLLTALSQEESRLKGLRLGVDDYITKPFSVPELNIRIQNLIASNAARTQYIQEEEIESKSQFLSVNDKLIQEAEQFIFSRIEDADLSVELLAQHLNYSQRQFSRIVKTQTGFTGLQLIRELRLRRAFELLENQQVATVSEVAHLVGFEKVAYFSKRFQDRFGRNPSELLSRTRTVA